MRPPPPSDDDAAVVRRHDAIPDPLPRPPFLAVACGAVRAGKSTMAMNAIYRWWRGAFARVVYISPTVLQDATLHVLAADREIAKVTDHLDRVDEVFAALLKSKMEDPETAREHWLICLDDLIGYLVPSGPRAAIVNTCTRFRHSRLSLLFMVQSFRALPPQVRSNAGFYLLWHTNSARELGKMDDEFGGTFPHFAAMFRYATKVSFRPLVLDLGRRLRAFAGLTHLLWEAPH